MADEGYFMDNAENGSPELEGDLREPGNDDINKVPLAFGEGSRPEQRSKFFAGPETLGETRTFDLFAVQQVFDGEDLKAWVVFVPAFGMVETFSDGFG